MTLSKAHKGYEYQDLITAYFIIEEIIDDYNSSFKIDQKEFKNDKFDDLTVIRDQKVLKKQIKYSDNHILKKPDLSAKGTYDLAIDLLYSSWLSNPEREKIKDIRLCLAWGEPIDDELIKVLVIDNSNKSFKSFKTLQYKINIGRLWEKNKPLSSWKRLGVESKNIDKNLFTQFCENLIIEVEFPKFSLDFDEPSDLEALILSQIEQLGIGIYPNDKIHPIDFINRLLHLIRNYRINQQLLTTEQIFNKLNIKRDFGSIKQIFPVNPKENISLKNRLDTFYNYLNEKRRIILTGEPGSGKSWFVNNLIKFLEKKNINVVKHYCYTDLEDEFQKERIKLNVFYGNLISDILNSFPDLHKKKKNKFGSSLSELNELLLNISEETVIIIDGLDHIDRIYEFRDFRDITKQETAIINCLDKIKISNKVKIIATSQPVENLDLVKSFTRYEIPSWQLKQVKKLMIKLNLDDVFLNDFKINLSQFLFDKSTGNPLYLSYLIKEIKGNNFSLSKSSLSLLPDYSFNLELYYNYLLDRLNTKEQIPRVLSGVNFGLTKSELIEITGDGDDVESSLKSLSPILKHNFSRSGYIIYHESFRRFIINNLRERSVNIEKNIFSPIINWFEEKGLFEYQKAYRYYFSLLSDGKHYKSIAKYITIDFVFKSLINGQPWDLIEKNYDYLAYASIKNNDYVKIIITSEINKIISTTQDTFYELYNNYIEALGEIKGYKYVNNHLNFDGLPTVAPKLGLQSCYLCSINDYSPIWDIYFDEYFIKGEKIEIEDFHLFLRYYIDNKDSEQLIDICSRISKYTEYQEVFKNEVSKAKDLDFIGKLMKDRIVAKVFLDKKSSEKEVDINEICRELINCSFLQEKDIDLVSELVAFVKLNHNNKELIEYIINKFKNINWFYNWLIYLIEINIAHINIEDDCNELNRVFKYLILDTENFKGEPRTCDLYTIREVLFKSYRLGLSLIKKNTSWNKIINVLVQLSENTTTSMQGSLGGPLPPDELFLLLKEYSNQDNIEFILIVLEKQLKSKSEYHLHSYVAEYNFLLSQLYSKSNRFEEAKKAFELGVKYSIGYTYRKDITLSELIISLENVNSLGEEFALEALKKTKILVDSVVNHTDGKETKHYPVSWFEAFSKNDIYNSSLYLRNELNNSRYDWRLETNLLNILNEVKGDVKPIIKLFLLRTFIIESSESHLNECLDVYSLTKDEHPIISSSFLSSIYIKSEADKSSTTGFSSKFIERLNNVFQNKADIILPQNNNKIPKKNEKNYSNIIEVFKSRYKDRKCFSEMQPEEMKSYLYEKKINKNELNSLCYYFDQFNSLTDALKNLIKTIVKGGKYTSVHNFDYEVLFTNNNEIALYYWVCCFVYDRGTWHEEFTNIPALKEAYNIDKEAVWVFLNEFLEDKLSKGFNVGVSGNLINAFIETNQDKATIKEIWNNLFNCMSERLPSKADYEWEDSLNNEIKMNVEEIFVCILITRFNSNTVERFQHALTGISYLLYNYPELLIKPLKWFFSNQEKYLKSILVSIITLLYEYNKDNPDYKNNFKQEIDLIYPLNYYLFDIAVELMYSKKKKDTILIEGSDLIYNEEIKEGEFEFFLKLNSRHTKLFQRFPGNLIQIYGKYKRTYNTKYGDYLELYYSRSNKIHVNNLYYYDYILELLNEDLYEELKNYNGQEMIFDDLTIDIKNIISQTNSSYYRPHDLELPHTMKEINQESINNDKQWIRIAHIEDEIFKEGRFEDGVEYKTFGSICFDKNKKKELPVGHLKSMPNMKYDLSEVFDNEIISYIFIQKKHHLEELKIIMLNPNLMNTLNLKKVKFNDGFSAENELGEIVLKYNSWKTNYIGNGHITGIADEVPLLDGAELVIRNDYLKKITNDKVFYRTIMIGNN